MILSVIVGLNKSREMIIGFNIKEIFLLVKVWVFYVVVYVWLVRV